MAVSIKNLIKFYSLCFREDNRTSVISNVFSKNIENLLFFRDEEQLANGFYPFTALDDDYAEKVLKKLKLAGRDKELIYGSVFLIGKENNDTIAAPLFLYPAEINKQEDFYSLKIKKDDRRINFGVFNEFVKDNEMLNSFTEEFFTAVSGYDIDESTIYAISKVFEKYFDFIDVSSIVSFPKLTNEKKVKYLLKKLKDFSFYLLPSSALFLTKKSAKTRGIINELDKLAKTEDFSEPLQYLFGLKDEFLYTETSKGFVPAILSEQQEKIIKNSGLNPVSVIIGPPGTGKSYTVSALAISKFSIGKNVLITAATEQALNVIYEKITQISGIENLALKTYDKEFVINYLTSFESIVSDLEKEKFVLDTGKKDINKLTHKIQKTEKKFKKTVAKHIKIGNKLNGLNQNKFFNLLIIKYLKHKINSALPPEKLSEDLYDLYNQRMKKIKDFLKKTYTNQRLTFINKSDLKPIKFLLKVIKSRSSRKRQEYFSKFNFYSLFYLFPIWLVKLSDLSEFLPLRKHLFSYVILDEATQSDMASVIPAVQRAEHLIVTGDPKQLRHFSFLSRTKQNILAQKSDCENYPEYFTDYRTYSFLDLAMNSIQNFGQIIFLDEHFRSKPAIIKFSNTKFYANKLKIMLARPDMPQNEGIKIINCNGNRTQTGYNKEEADCVLDILKKHIENQKDLPQNLADTSGILSPFRDQTEYINSLIMKNLPIDIIEKHKIIVKTPYGFQGDERDIMVLSFALDNKSHPSAFRYMNNPNVFNVAITRARKIQYILHSVNPQKIIRDSLLRQYLQSFDRQQVTNQQIYEDDFLIEIKNYFKNKGYKTWTLFQIAGVNIDLVIKKYDKILGIDLIGFPGKLEDAFPIEKYKILYRSGLKIIPISYPVWYFQKDKFLKNFE